MEIKKLLVANTCNIREAIKILDFGGKGIVFVVDAKNCVNGIVTDGDFRRAVLKNISLEKNIKSITNTNFISLDIKSTDKEVVNTFLLNPTIEILPIINDGRLIKILQKSDYKLTGISDLKENQLNNKVVIMAGGKGRRLDPFTRVLPKPLIPIGDDPIIKYIMNQFCLFGMKDFYIALNEKKNMIKAYFNEINSNYRINYIEENKPLGTAGALKHLFGKIQEPFFVTNCDIIIKSNYSEIMAFHTTRHNSLTLVVSMQHHTIPYGVCKINNGGDILTLLEKPENDYLANTGFYVIDPNILQYIPDDTLFNMTDLIAIAQQKNLKVGGFPISEGSWLDVGTWDEYKKTMNQLYSK